MTLKRHRKGDAEQTSTTHPRRSVPRVRIHASEHIVDVARPARSASLPKYVITLGLYGIWRKRHTFVLTDRRVIVGKGVFGRTERSIPLDRIDDAVYRRQGAYGYSEIVCFDRAGRWVERIGPLSPWRAKSFTNEVLQSILP